MNEQIARSVEQAGLEQIRTSAPLSGGCISEVCRVTLSSGKTIIAKHHNDPPKNLFEAEADGLNALCATESIRVPEVISVSENVILLEDLGHGSPPNNYWQSLGQGLARLHSQEQTQFGFFGDNYCGATPQDNSPTKSGYEFFANCRLLPLGNIASNRGLLEKRDLQQLEYIANHLDQWIPSAPAVLIHGDLWSGNIHCTGEGMPALIDPAAYWGWAEAEIAMTKLFGGFDHAFYDSYLESHPLEQDWRERIPLYNLYHLLNHLILFGGSYHASVRSILNQYAD